MSKPIRVPVPRTARMRSLALATIALALVTAGCSEQDGRRLRDPNPSQTDTITQQTTTSTIPADQRLMTVSGPWTEGQPIDPRYTCDGLDISPSLSWGDVPEGTATLAVVLSDMDAPEYIHWVVANIPVSTTSLSEDYSDPLVAEAANSAGSAGYSGPCPPEGATHSYDVTVYAVSQVLEVQNGDPAPGMIAAIEAAAIEAASTSFTFSR